LLNQGSRKTLLRTVADELDKQGILDAVAPAAAH
jgi:hypothetical protein